MTRFKRTLLIKMGTVIVSAFGGADEKCLFCSIKLHASGFEEL